MALIQCAGSRDQNHLPYCSGICCLGSLKHAAYLREQYADAEVDIYYIDIRANDKLEAFYNRVRADPQVHFIKSKPGAITIGDLVKNALRMRPDRIILGEIRGAECFDLLAAMNTGHDGSMCTLHANSPREALGRMENMILMGDIKIPKEAISRQIAESVDLIVQVKRLRDGSRRTTNITEVIGMEGDVIVTQELFKFEYLDEGEDGKIMGEYRSSGLRPYTLEKARQFGFDQAYLEACL